MTRLRIWVMWHITDRIHNWWFHSPLARAYRNWRYYRTDRKLFK